MSCSELVMDFEIVGLEVFFIAFEKINSGLRFSVRSFHMACSLGVRYFVWNWMISVSLLNFWLLLEKAWSTALQWYHFTSILVHLSLMSLWSVTAHTLLLFHGICSLCAHT